MSSILGRYVNNATEALVGTSCATVTSLSDQVSAMFTSLQNNTLYRLAMVLTDTSNNQVRPHCRLKTRHGPAPTLPPVLALALISR